MKLDYCGTKEQIFEQSVRLFSMMGYESVSMRDIAEAVGIQQSSIYNHYESKAGIIGAIYQYFRENHDRGRYIIDDMLIIIRSGNIDEIIDAFTGISFIRLDQSEAARLMLITKIIYTRMFFDPVAAEIYKEISVRSISYVQKALDFGIETGLFRSFDTYGFSYALFSMYTQLGIDAFSRPDYQPGEHALEVKIKTWMREILNERLICDSKY